MKTTLRRLLDSEFEILFHHGFEATDATLTAYIPEAFVHMPYDV